MNKKIRRQLERQKKVKVFSSPRLKSFFLTEEKRTRGQPVTMVQGGLPGLGKKK